MSENQPLLSPHSSDMNLKSLHQKWRERTGRFLGCARLHKLIIALTATDVMLVLIDIGYTLIAPGCKAPGEESPHWLEVLSLISLAITMLFVVEVPLTLWSLGFEYMNPFGSIPHAGLHLFDAIVILTTFIFEAVLRGSEREFAGLLIVFRLWRLVELVEGVALSTAELEEENARELVALRDELAEVRAELAKSEGENNELRYRLSLGVSAV